MTPKIEKLMEALDNRYITPLDVYDAALHAAAQRCEEMAEALKEGAAGRANALETAAEAIREMLQDTRP